MKRYFLFAVATLASIFAPSLYAYPSYPYPDKYPDKYKYKGASATGPWQYSADGGTSAGFAVPAGNIKNGELIGYSAAVTLPYNVNYAVQASIRLGDQAGHVDETYKLSAFGESQSLDREIWWRCFLPTCGGSTGSNVSLSNPPSLGVSSFDKVPTFEQYRNSGDPNWASNYERDITARFGGTAVNFSVDSKKSDDKGKVLSFGNDSTYTGGGGYQFRPWTTTDVLSGVIHPIVENNYRGGAGARILVPDTTTIPLFGFTIEEAAHLSGYDHFNWLQQISEVRLNPDPINPLSSNVIYNKDTGNLNDLIQNIDFGRGIGPDPRMGCLYDPTVKPNECKQDIFQADNIPLYLDEEVNGYVAPRNFAKDPTTGKPATDYRWNAPRWGSGLYFEDLPNLKIAGAEVFFTTELVGVKYGANGAYESYDVFSRLNIPNPEDFVFRWKFTQTEASTGNIGMLQNVDELLAGIGKIEFLGMGFGGLEPPPIPDIPDGGTGGNGGNGGNGGGGGNGGNGGSEPPIPTPIPGTAWLALLGLTAMWLTRKRLVIRL